MVVPGLSGDEMLPGDGAGRFGLFFFPVLPTGRAAKGVGCFEAVALNSSAGGRKA